MRNITIPGFSAEGSLNSEKQRYRSAFESALPDSVIRPEVIAPPWCSYCVEDSSGRWECFRVPCTGPWGPRQV